MSSNVTRNDRKKLKKASSGNRCGHQPDAPRFFAPPPKHKRRPPLIKESYRALEKYYGCPSFLPVLNSVNKSERQQRSERREACILILSCILHFTDQITLIVGVPKSDGSIMGLTMPYLATLAGLSLRRSERAVHDLKAAGIITVHPICEKLTETSYKGYAAIRTVTKYLFTVFGFDSEWVAEQQKKAKEKKEKKAEKERLKALANVKMGINAAKVIDKYKQAGQPVAVADILAAIKMDLDGSPPPPPP